MDDNLKVYKNIHVIKDIHTKRMNDMTKRMIAYF